MTGRRISLGVLLLALISLDRLAKGTLPVRWINPGIAFSMFPGASLYLDILPVAILALLTRVWRKRAAFCLPLILLWGSLLSNLYDRIVKGAVVDIFHLGPFMFNLANVWILTTIILFVLRRRATGPF